MQLTKGFQCDAGKKTTTHPPVAQKDLEAMRTMACHMNGLPVVVNCMQDILRDYLNGEHIVRLLPFLRCTVCIHLFRARVFTSTGLTWTGRQFDNS